MKRYLLKSMLLIAALLIITSNLSAQRLIDMTCTVFDGTWEPISGTQIMGASDDGTVLVDWNSLGFAFKWDDVSRTQAFISANGFMLFSPYYYYTIGPSNLYDNRPGIHVLARDGYVRQSINYELRGNAPNRVLIFQWNNYDVYYGNNTGTFTDYQIRLYETSNIVEVIFGDVNCGSYAWGSEYNGVLLGFGTDRSNEDRKSVV